jgi:hypothetical protein
MIIATGGEAEVMSDYNHEIAPTGSGYKGLSQLAHDFGGNGGFLKQ